MIRQAIKAATGGNVWLRYSFLAPWRLLYAASAAVSGKNISGDHQEGPQEVQRYAEKLFAEYKCWSGVSRFYGRVAELGPGNVSAIAQMFIADGCTQVDQIDRFVYSTNGAGPAIHLYHEPAETFFTSHSGYDFIVSCAVMEHLYDPLRALRAMASALNPGGMMIHVVDCRDHGQFSDRLHDLSFLRIPVPLYKPLALASGLNRVRLSPYLSTLEPLGFTCKVLVTELSGVPERITPARDFGQLDNAILNRSRENLSQIKCRLAQTFRDMDDKELMIAVFVLVAVKPLTEPTPP